jgi:hypothetical protein
MSEVIEIASDPLFHAETHRVGQQGTLTRLWARRGSRPRAVRDTRYEWAYIFGAVCPRRGVGAALVMPYADTEAMNAPLRDQPMRGRRCSRRPRARRSRLACGFRAEAAHRSEMMSPTVPG